MRVAAKAVPIAEKKEIAHHCLRLRITRTETTGTVATGKERVQKKATPPANMGNKELFAKLPNKVRSSWFFISQVEEICKAGRGCSPD